MIAVRIEKCWYSMGDRGGRADNVEKDGDKLDLGSRVRNGFESAYGSI